MYLIFEFLNFECSVQSDDVIPPCDDVINASISSLHLVDVVGRGIDSNDS